MPYEVTASRRRPKGFEELAGQEFVSATLKASIQTGRIAHAYLFAGPRGCGKTSTARILARALNCERGPTASPCGECSNCRSISSGSSLDVIEIDGASNTSVDNVRQIKDEVLFPPNAGRYKIYIIDEVHMLSNSAFNALLKTIEEPPPYIVFMFATTELHKVPATIKSRCQQFNFRLIPLPEIKRLLAAAAAELAVKADDDALLWIAKEATGSQRDAYTLFDQVVAFSDGHITAAKIRDKLGLVGVERLNGLFEACVKGDRAAALGLLDSMLTRGVSVEQCVTDAVGYLRALLLVRNGVRSETLVGDDPAAYSGTVLTALGPERIERALAYFFDLHRDIRYSVNPRFELELAIARLCSIGDYIAPEELARAVNGLRAAVAGNPPPPEEKKNAKSVVEPVGEPDGESVEGVGLRERVIASIRNSNIILANSLGKSLDWEIVDGRLIIEFAGEYEASLARQDIAVVTEKVRDLGAQALRVEFKVAAQAVAPSESEESECRSEDPVAIVERVFRGRRIGDTQRGANAAERKEG